MLCWLSLRTRTNPYRTSGERLKPSKSSKRYNHPMTVIRTSLSGDLEKALEHYRQAHAEDPEAIVQKALKRFLLEEGFPAEDESLNEDELEALEQHKRGSSDYESWQDIKTTL